MNTLINIKQWKSISHADRPSWYIPEEITTSFPIAETDERLINMHTYANQHHVPLAIGKEGLKMFSRASVAQKTLKAIRLITKRSGNQITLKIIEAFRSIETQRREFNQIRDRLAETEKLQGRELWHRVTQFIADPDLCPPHSTGGAIDCTLILTKSKKELDMGTPVNTVSNKASTWHKNISNQAKKNRLLLYEAMTDAGFVNLTTEWWHYSYGDQYWAIYKERKQALYGTLCHLPG